MRTRRDDDEEQVKRKACFKNRIAEKRFEKQRNGDETKKSSTTTSTRARGFLTGKKRDNQQQRKKIKQGDEQKHFKRARKVFLLMKNTTKSVYSKGFLGFAPSRCPPLSGISERGWAGALPLSFSNPSKALGHSNNASQRNATI